MNPEHIADYLRSLDEPEMAEEVMTMHNRLEYFALGLPQTCDRVQLQATQQMIREFLEHWDAPCGSRMGLEIPSAVEALRESL